MTFLILAGIGLTGLMLVWPDFRAQVFASARDFVQTLRSRVGGEAEKPALAPPHEAAARGTQSAADTEPPQRVHLQATVEAPSTGPAENPGAGSVAKSSPPLSADVQAQAVNRQPVPEPAQAAPATSMPAASDEDPIDRARSLWIHAIDAEARQDYPEAIKYYEQIKKLPESAWPKGLEIRLQAAKKQVQ